MPPVVILPNISTTLNDEGFLEIDFLLPTGIIIPMKVNFFSTLDRLKEDLWREARNRPLRKLLKESDSYCFVCINHLGVKEELLDESQCLDDIKPFSSFLKLVEKQGDKESKTLTRNINHLLGKDLNSETQKMETWSRAEVSEFRQKMAQVCEKIIRCAEQSGWEAKLGLTHPPSLRSTNDMPEKMKERIGGEKFDMDVVIKATSTSYKLKASMMETPSDFIERVLTKRSKNTGQPLESSDCYLLKIIGREEFVYGSYPLIKFKYIYQCLTKNETPKFWLIEREEVVDSAPAVPPRSVDRNPSVVTSERQGPCVWDIKQKYYVTVKGISKIQLLDNIKVKLFIGLYHGSEPLCELRDTGEVPVLNNSCNMTIDLKFDIAVADLPNASRICFALYSSGRKSGKDMTPIAWLNIPVFDFRLRLIRGEKEMDMWSVKDALIFEDICNVLGGVCPNPYGHDAATLLVSFPDYNIQSDITFPSNEKVIEFGKMVDDQSEKKVSKWHIDQLKTVLERDAMTQMFEQDKDLLWLLRHKCHQQYPTALSKLLNSVKWNKKEDTAMMAVLLDTWPVLPVDHALELLDFNFPDKNVREFAIKCLDERLGDSDMFLYLLQLVQAVKYENYLNCPLVKFLLTRAVKNQHIGQQLFWHLKSEMHDPSVMLRFRLILDVYLRSRKDHLTVLLKQNECLNKLTALSNLVKNKQCNVTETKSKQRTITDMIKILQQKSYHACLSDLYSPLSPVYKLNELKVEKCTIMTSKKRPLLLHWSIEGDNKEDASMNLIFKNGDDLRQDMLTLQMFKIMDGIWLEEGLDLRMNAYGVLATGPEQGIIEVVTESKTIASIQKWYGKGTFDKRALFEWLKSHNDTEKSLDNAVEEFIASCAGYCVATYVLGIGDRHNDNIMLKTSGQLFHIDFGHFLGNFKSKFGLRRDRVPFVLTSHFVHVINKGESTSKNFDKFKSYCEQAYISLRRKSHLLFSLFMMMLSSGIPQLTCTRDVEYLKETLKPHLSEQDALTHFRGKFDEANNKSWTTNVQFYIHLMATNKTSENDQK